MNAKTRKITTNTQNEYFTAVHNIIQNCMRVTPKDRVIIITDEEREDIGSAIFSESVKLAESKILKIEDFVKRPAKEFPIRFRKAILEFAPSTYKLETRTYKIIANIPYNITGAILKKFLTAELKPERMVLLVQKEVAERIVARPARGRAGGKESILSTSVKAYGTPKVIMKVPKRYFSPAPKVDSAIIVIKNISRKIFEENGVDEQKFWEIVRTGFAHKRKKLSGNLKGLIPEEILVNLGNKRAEELTLSDWISLAR